jgi:hypothetical protein
MQIALVAILEQDEHAARPDLMFGSSQAMALSVQLNSFCHS